MKEIRLPEICLVLLVGPSSSGKSTFARKYFKPTEVISSDFCRALVSDDENDQDATKDAFEVLQFLAAKRLKRGKLTVIDALNIRKEDRAKLVQLARDNYALAAAIVLETPIRKMHERHALRPDRTFGRNILEKQYESYKQSLRSVKHEGFGYTYFIDPEEEQTIVRQPLWNNKKDAHGPFDIIGDVHGCIEELLELLETLGYSVEKLPEGNYRIAHPENRNLIFLGDLVDRGPDSPEVLRLVMDAVHAGIAFCIRGNHDDKLQKFLLGKDVNLSFGLEKTVQQLAEKPKSFKDEVTAFLDTLIAHYVLDEGKLVVAHAGIPEAMQGRAAAAVRAFCLFGETDGETDEFGLPVRYNWAKNYAGKALVVYGHTPVPQIEWLNNSVNIDQGCVFGGKLTALRYPEKQTVSVQAKKVYAEPIRPLQAEVEQVLSAQHEHDDLLDIGIIKDKYQVETVFGTRVIVREENAIAALEVMSRFAADPKWLIYLPPTMSPPETSKLPEFLEHPAEVFSFFRKHGINQVICEEKHMGSRAITIICKDPEVAVKRFGMHQPSPGIIYTRTGRHFFDEPEEERLFLAEIHQALTAAGFWDEYHTDWVCLDGELLPWSTKAKALLINQYAAVGASATNGLQQTEAALAKALERGIPTETLLQETRDRKQSIVGYIASYRNYSRETTGIRGLTYAPFHLLATEGKTYRDKPHTWHMEQLQKLCAYNQTYLQVTNYLLVNLNNQASMQEGINWWLGMTAKGGEGMVVKPLDFVPQANERLLQPAMKCRGPEYLRIIYGPEYDLGENLQTLKKRSVRTKRMLALQEFTLGLEALDRFVKQEPLRRVHECVFGILALESEAVDPRL